MSRFLFILPAMIVVLVGSHRAQAQHAGDIFVSLNGQQIVVGRINPDQTIDPTVRVFASTFGDSGFPGFTSNPGFDAALVFNPQYRIGFNILDGLQFWNGSLFELTGGETLNVSFVSLERDTADCFVAGFDLAVQANGGWHRHLSFFLEAAGKGDPDPGVYLLKLELYYTAPGSENSPPFWIVFNHNASLAQHNAAIAWVNANLVVPPCPGDVNFTGVVDIDDLLFVVNGWGASPCDPGDIDDDGVVNIDDLLVIINGWGACP